MMKYKLKDVIAMQEFAKDLAKSLKVGDCLALIGDLGTGKTTISQMVGKALGVKSAMPSPTFALMNEYDLDKGKLIHSDVYRLADEEELYEIGFEEYFNDENIIIVEWADLIMPFLREYSQHLIVIEIDYAEEGRIVTINS